MPLEQTVPQVTVETFVPDTQPQNCCGAGVALIPATEVALVTALEMPELLKPCIAAYSAPAWAGVLHLQVTVKTHSKISNRDYHQAKDSAKNAKFNGSRGALGFHKISEFTVHISASHYSTRLAIDVPIGWVP